MTAQRLAGVLIILGILLALVASVVFPGDYYRAKSDEARQAILDANRSAWLATNWLWIAATAATASGLALIAQRNRDWLSYTGAGLFAVGSLFWVAYLYLRWLNPSIATDRLWMEGVFASLTAGGLALLGIAFIRGAFPRWVGFVNLGYGILFLLLFLPFRSRMIASFPPQVVYLIP